MTRTISKWESRGRLLLGLALASSLAGCYSSYSRSNADDGSTDGTIDGSLDGSPDPIPDTSVEYPTSLPDGRSGTLIAGPYELAYRAEPDGEVDFEQNVRSVAFGGTDYEIVAFKGASHPDTAGVYRLVPERVVPRDWLLYTSWLDSEPDVVKYSSICWSGEVFVALLPTEGVGLRLIVVDEHGELVRPVEILGARPDYEVVGDDVTVLCPSTGPFVMDSFDGDTIYPLGFDGRPAGTPISIEHPHFRVLKCTEAGAEAVCPRLEGIAFIDRDGGQRLSDPLPSGYQACNDGCAVAFTGEYVALAFTAEGEDDERYMAYTLYSMYGELLVGPVVGRRVEHGRPQRFKAASSGDTVLVTAAPPDDTRPYDPPQAHLLDLLGNPMCPPLQVTMYDLSYVDSSLELLWNGELYAMFWSTSSGYMSESVIVYQHFFIDD